LSSEQGHGFIPYGVGSFDPVPIPFRISPPVASISSGPFADPGNGKLGNIGRNSFHGPSGFYSDMSAVKKFTITERLNAQFRVDAFNVFQPPVYAFSANNGASTCIDCQGAITGRSPAWRAERLCGNCNLPFASIFNHAIRIFYRGSHRLPLFCPVLANYLWSNFQAGSFRIS